MKKILPFILPVFIFLPTFLYLHQKVQIYTEAYRLSQNYGRYNELVDKRDYLMYNFSKAISLDKINQWAQKQDFNSVSGRRVIILSKQEEAQVKNKATLLLDRFLRASVATSTALAEEKR